MKGREDGDDVGNVDGESYTEDGNWEETEAQMASTARLVKLNMEGN
jgi:hypothetical protein